MTDNTVFFDQPGSQNTEEVLEVVEKQAQKLGISTLVIASTSGSTALKAWEKLGDKLEIIAVGTYYRRCEPEKVEKFENKDGKFIFAFEDLDYDYPEFLQKELRQEIGQGGKVALEVVVAATQAGLIDEGEKAIGVGGAYPGADTAFLVKATEEFDRSKVEKILCCPKH
ncbi:MAG: hypothetical protein ACOC6Q_00700 [Patescibacteria group bacterium]